MGVFFQTLKRTGQEQEWFPVLDWLFDDLKFQESRFWNREKSKKYTTAIKKFANLDTKKNNYFHLKAKDLNFHQLIHIHKRMNNALFILQKDSHEHVSVGVIRHIRNAIAHGNVKIYLQHPIFIEINDFNKRKTQTAYFYIPLCYVKNFYDLYCDLKTDSNAIKPDIPKTRNSGKGKGRKK